MFKFCRFCDRQLKLGHTPLVCELNSEFNIFSTGLQDVTPSQTRLFHDPNRTGVGQIAWYRSKGQTHHYTKSALSGWTHTHTYTQRRNGAKYVVMQYALRLYIQPKNAPLSKFKHYFPLFVFGPLNLMLHWASKNISYLFVRKRLSM